MTKPFEAWLVRRVAQAVEVGEVPSDLLTDLQADIEAAKDLPQGEAHARALGEIVERLGIGRAR